MGIDIKGVDLTRVFLYVYVFQGFRVTRADARNVVGEDATVCAGREDHGVVVPFDVADIQLIGCSSFDRRRLGGNGGPDVGALAEVEVEAGRIIEDNGLEDVRSGEGDGAPVRGDIEAGDGNAREVYRILGLGRAVGRGRRGRSGGVVRGRGGARVGRGVWGGLAAEELAHNLGVATIHCALEAAAPSAASLKVGIASQVAKRGWRGSSKAGWLSNNDAGADGHGRIEARAGGN